VVPLGQRKGGRHRLGDQRAAAGKLDRTAGDRDLEQLAGLRAVAAPAAARPAGEDARTPSTVPGISSAGRMSSSVIARNYSRE